MTHGLPFDFYRKGGKIFWKKGLFSIFTKKLFVSDLLSRKRLFSIYLYIMKISLFPLHQNKIYSLCKKPQIVAPLVGVSKVHLITTTSLSCGCCSFMSWKCCNLVISHQRAALQARYWHAGLSVIDCQKCPSKIWRYHQLSIKKDIITRGQK